MQTSIVATEQVANHHLFRHSDVTHEGDAKLYLGCKKTYQSTPILQLFLKSLSDICLSILTAIFQVNLGQLVFIEAKDDGGGGDNWTTGAISRAKLQSNHHHQQTNI